MKNKTNRNVKIKQYLSIVGILLSVLFFVALFVFKDKIEDLSSDMIKQQTDSSIISSTEVYIDSVWNYTNNGSDYKMTFLEFGAKNCSACKRMEIVLEEVREKYPNYVKVVFVNVTLPQNQDMLNYFGISMIPTQLFLDEAGNEFFRHTGYYSTEEICKLIAK
ncbi:MAG: thioredoxin family protein [Bacteroidales bacterium]|jgi:thioredoxin 1|nr:thioredoxin family protein [Bacteroidales bacterium]